jgi:hypothetical protein
MSAKPESLSDIVRELREDAQHVEAEIHDDDFWSNDEAAGIYRDLADRIEAAAAREKQDAMKTAFLTKCQVCEKVGPSAPGNAAAMRAALNSIADIAKDAFGGPEREREASQGRALSLIIDAARAALAVAAWNRRAGEGKETK